MDEILIIGAGGMGREVFDYLLDLEKATPGRFRIKGFLDDNAEALGGRNYSCGVVGGISTYVPQPNELLVCALGNPRSKAAVCMSLKARGARFMSLVHPTARIGHNAVVGEGVVIAPHSVVNADARLGDFVFLNCFSACGHDSSVGDYTTLSSYCDVTGGVSIGQRVFLGSHASIIPGRRIGNDVSIGAGSIVVSHLADGRRVFGVPAKNIFQPKLT